MNQQVVEDILLFERGIQDGVRSAKNKHMQYMVLWHIAAGMCGLSALFFLFSLATRRHMDFKSYVALTVFVCSSLVLGFAPESDDVGRHCCRLNQVLRNFNIYYSPDTKTLFQLSPFHKQQQRKKARSPSGKSKPKRDNNMTTDLSSSPSSTSVLRFPTEKDDDINK